MSSNGQSSNTASTPNDSKADKKNSTPAPIKTPARPLGSAAMASKSSVGRASSNASSSGPNLAYIPGVSRVASTSASAAPAVGVGNVAASAPKKLNFKAKVVARTEPIEAPKSTQDAPTLSSSVSAAGRGRGRGDRGRGTRGDHGRGGGRGRGRGGSGGSFPPTMAPSEAVASGPFALGPGESLGGAASRRTAAIRFAASELGQSTTSFGLGGDGGNPVPHRSNLGGIGVGFKEEDREQYSDGDADEPGLQIVDVSEVKALDWMAPDALRKVTEVKRKKTKEAIVSSVKQEPEESSMELDEPELKDAAVDNANALDLEDSEEEDFVEDVVGDFYTIASEQTEPDQALSQDNRLYFFQFPSPFPTFIPSTTSQQKPEPDPDAGSAMDVDSEKPPGILKRSKSVSFAPETKPPVRVVEKGKEKEKEKEEAVPQPLDGLIGRLEIYRSGAVKMRLGDNILLDLSAATQPSFLQHAVYVDPGDANDEENSRARGSITVLGEVSRRFVVSPDVDFLLDNIERNELQAKGNAQSSAIVLD